MSLYIKVENGQSIDHPALETNLLQVFGEIPSNWELFSRIEKPFFDDPFKIVSEHSVYQKIDGVWVDVWDVRDATPEERAEIEQKMVNYANSTIEANIKLANQTLPILTDPEAIAAFERFKSASEAYVLVSVNPITPPLPAIPLKDRNGVWS